MNVYTSYNTGIRHADSEETQRKFVSAMCHAHLSALKLQKIVDMNADILETIKDRELGFHI